MVNVAMLAVSLTLNILVLGPVLVALAANGDVANRAWGADTAARRILAAIYATIFIASAVLLALHVLNHDIVAWASALLAMQVVYKVLTVPLVGLRNPVVISNLGIAIIHALTLAITTPRL